MACNWNIQKAAAPASRTLLHCGVTAALLVAGGLSCSRTGMDISGSAEMLRAAALRQASQEHKHVFLLFTSPDCQWCKRYEAYHGDPDVMRIIGKHFVLLKIDIEETPGGEHLFGEHGGESLPRFSILNDNGMIVASSGEGERNIGFPTKEDEVAGYFVALRTACSSLTAGEESLLREKLAAVNPTQSLSGD